MAEPTDDLRQWMATAGVEQRVGAHMARPLSSELAWFVVSGQVALFVQHVGEPVPGRRRFVARVGDGTVLWPGPHWSPGDATRVLMVPEPDTIVRAIPVDELQAADHGGGAEELAHHLVGELLVAVDDGTPSHIDAESAALDEVISAIDQRRFAEERDVAQRISASVDAAGVRLDDALTDLADVTTGDAVRPPAHTQADMLVSALARLGFEIGVEFPPLHREVSDPRAVLVEQCRAAGVRRRTVTLPTRWWRRPGVPFLGYVDSGRRPVAVYPHRAGWMLFDPRLGVEQPIDDVVAARFSTTADALYPPLPDGDITVRTIGRFVFGGTRRSIGTLVGAGLLAGILGLAIPLAVNLVYDSVLPARDGWLLLSVVVLLVGAGVSATLASLSRNLALVRVQGVSQARLDPAVIDRLLRIHSGSMREWAAGDTANRIIGLQRIRNQLSGSVATAFLTLIFSSVSVLLVFAYSPLLGVTAGVSVLIVLWVLGMLTRAWADHQSRAFERSGVVTALLYESLGGISKLRVAGAQRRLLARWAEEFSGQQRAEFAAGRLRSWTIALATALPAIGLLPVYVIAGTLVRDDLAPGQFLAVVTALGQLTGAAAAAALSVSSVLIAVPLWRRLRPLLDAPLEPRGEAPGDNLRGKIEIVGATFAYESGAAPVLRDVSLVAEPGEFVALTGPSGAGKSTVLRLILGLERADEGTVLFDDRDISLLDMAAMRRRIGVVSQNVKPIPGSIQEVITGSSDGPDDRAWEAAEMAGLADDIRRLPMGMQTLVAEQGATFSGGQIQRLMIARALARRPAVLLFDEATSALDGKLQAEVSDRLAAMSVTRIVIAHRLSTIRMADRIYVIDDGTVAEAGTFDTLVAAGGMFSRLVHRQIA